MEDWKGTDWMAWVGVPILALAVVWSLWTSTGTSNELIGLQVQVEAQQSEISRLQRQLGVAAARGKNPLKPPTKGKKGKASKGKRKAKGGKMKGGRRKGAKTKKKAPKQRPPQKPPSE